MFEGSSNEDDDVQSNNDNNDKDTSNSDNSDNNNNDKNNNNNERGESDTSEITPETQRRKESEAVMKQSEAVHESLEVFADLKEKAETATANSHENSDGGASDDLMQTVRFLIMSEQTDALTSVLKRLNGDKQAWETVQREPVALVAMIIEEQQKRMSALQEKVARATAAHKG